MGVKHILEGLPKHMTHSLTNKIAAPFMLALIGAGALGTAGTAFAQDGKATAPYIAVNSSDNAVSGEKWDELAQITSQGDWKQVNKAANTYGGLGISQQTWVDNGGIRFGELPSDANRAEQIEIAENIYEKSGWTPWDGAKLLGWIPVPAPAPAPASPAGQAVGTYTAPDATVYTQGTTGTVSSTYSAPAQAAPAPAQTSNYATGGTQWDQLAQCESGGNWGTNTGNGFSGGLQFSPDTWAAYGGQGDASGASREQQIAVAERVQAAQGWGAWPSCSAQLGLQ